MSLCISKWLGIQIVISLVLKYAFFSSVIIFIFYPTGVEMSLFFILFTLSIEFTLNTTLYAKIEKS